MLLLSSISKVYKKSRSPVHYALEFDPRQQDFTDHAPCKFLIGKAIPEGL